MLFSIDLSSRFCPYSKEMGLDKEWLIKLATDLSIPFKESWFHLLVWPTTFLLSTSSVIYHLLFSLLCFLLDCIVELCLEFLVRNLTSLLKIPWIWCLLFSSSLFLTFIVFFAQCCLRKVFSFLVFRYWWITFIFNFNC